MKKIIAILTAALFVLMLVPAVSAESSDITKNGVVSASSENVGNEKAEDNHPASKLVDGDISSFWEAASGKNNGEWFELTFEDAYKIDKLVISWGGGRANEGGFTVSVGEDESSLQETAINASREEQSSTLYVDTVTLNATGKVVRVTVNNAAKEMLQCWEVAVYGEKVEAPSEDDTSSEDETPSEGDTSSEDETPSEDDTSSEDENPDDVPHDGVEPYAVWAVVMMLTAGAAVVVSRKVRA